MKVIIASLFLIFSVSVSANTSDLKLEFSPETDKFIEATKAYQKIWNSDGKKIIETMEKTSGLQFRQKEIKVIVYEGVSYSGFKSRPMKMRASYSFDVKKGTLIHELGHRLIEGVPETAGIDNHRILFLFLYDVWQKLYGKEFADNLVKIESGRRGLYDYEAAWKWALSMNAEKRKAKLSELSNAENALRSAFNKFNDAFLKADSAVLESLLTYNYIHTNGRSGSVLDRPKWLAYIKTRKTDLDSGKLKVGSYSVQNVRVKIFIDSAVITATIFSKGENAGKPFDSKIQITTFWVKIRGKWKRAVFHDSPVPK